MDNKVEQVISPALGQADEEEMLMEGVVRVEDSPRAGMVLSFENAPIKRTAPVTPSRLVCLNVQAPAAAEFGLLAARLNRFKVQNRMRRVLVAGCGIGTGASVISANLALVLAQNPAHRVLLVDANLERPSLSGLFGLPPESGLSDHLKSGKPVEDLVCRLEPGGIWFLPAGPPLRKTADSGQIYYSQRLACLLRMETDWFDWVVVDPPSLETWLASRAVAQLCDGIILVVRKGHTERKAFQRALDLLDGLPILGIAWNE